MSEAPKILVVARFRPDGPARWLADALQLAGCRVVRAGLPDFEGFPPAERPHIYQPPAMTRRIGAPDPPCDIAAVIDWVARPASPTGSFTPEAILVAPWGDPPPDTNISAAPSLLLQDLGEEGFAVGGERYPAAVCPFTYRPPARAVQRSGTICHLDRAPITARVRALQSAAVVSAPTFEMALQAAACGARVTGEYEGIDRFVVLAARTWHARALAVLAQIGLEPGPVPQMRW